MYQFRKILKPIALKFGFFNQITYFIHFTINSVFPFIILFLHFNLIIFKTLLRSMKGKLKALSIFLKIRYFELLDP